MYNASAEFMAMALNNTRELAVKATLQTADSTYNLEAKDFEQGKITIKDSCMSKGFELGTAIAKDITIELNNRDGRWDEVILDGATLTVYCGFKLSNGTEYVPMGVFIVDQPGRPYSSLQLKATDRMILLDEPLQDVDIGWPATHRTLISAIAQHCNVPLAGSVLDLLSMEYIIPEPADLDKLTCRDAVGELALMACGFARFSRTAPLEKQLELVHLFPEWKPSVSLETGKRIQHKGILYEVIQAHTTQDDWMPTETPALLKQLSPVEEVDKPQPWVQPTGAHDACMTGDKMIYTDDKTYESLIDNNVWSPVDYPTGWKEVTE